MAQRSVWSEAEHSDPRPGEHGYRVGQPRKGITLHPCQHEINAAVRATSSIVDLCRVANAGKNRRCVCVLLDVPLKPYDDEGLARLLRLLRPAPEGWVTKAQRIPLDMSIPERPLAEETLIDGDLAELGRKLEFDSMFRRRFDADPVAAAQAAGMHELALGLEREIRGLVGLAERIANDDAYRAELVTDPVVALVGAGIPAATAEPLLQALAVPDEVLARLPEVVAHQHEQLPLKARLLILLLGSTAVAEEIRSPEPGA